MDNKKTSAQLVNQSSGKQNWRTPDTILTPARIVMGGIDLDPASNEQANQYVRADTIYTPEIDGLAQRWFGRVWINWPYGTKENRAWIAKLVEEWENQHIEQVCGICYAGTSEKYFQPIQDYVYCLPNKRIRFIDPDTGKPGAQNTKGSAIFYRGPNIVSFGLAFAHLGAICVSHHASKVTLTEFMRFTSAYRTLQT